MLPPTMLWMFDQVIWGDMRILLILLEKLSQ
jgi:hypothetical protein